MIILREAKFEFLTRFYLTRPWRYCARRDYCKHSAPGNCDRFITAALPREIGCRTPHADFASDPRRRDVFRQNPTFDEKLSNFQSPGLGRNHFPIAYNIQKR